MKGDFSKMTFNPDKNFLRVLMQQGRVQLDSDWNEQAAILLHYMQTLAADLIGPYAGPVDNLGFTISNAGNGNFTIGKGRYYVDGVLCENHADVTYFEQMNYPLNAEKDALTPSNYLVYLDVWERHISYVEDDDIREKALNGVDTATRSKVIWQVKVKDIENQVWSDAVQTLKKDALLLSEVCLRAWVSPDNANADPCCQHPEAKYRGAENQLYRVEIHNADAEKFTFKWSRENGSMVFLVTNISVAKTTITVELEHLGRDGKFGLAVNDWVELVDDNSVLMNIAYPLLQVHAIDHTTRTVELTESIPRVDPLVYDESKHPLLRRWDQKNADANGVAVVFNEQPPTGIEIEAGIKVEFKLSGKALQTGDYWLIPARTNTADVEWSSQKDANDKVIPAFMSPHGVDHRYAPLAIIKVGNDGNIGVSDYRCSFKPLSYNCLYSYYGRLGQGIGTDLLCPDEAK